MRKGAAPTLPEPSVHWIRVANWTLHKNHRQENKSQMRCDMPKMQLPMLDPAHFPGNRMTMFSQRRAECSAVSFVRRDISPGDLGLDPYVTGQQHDLGGRWTGFLFRM